MAITIFALYVAICLIVARIGSKRGALGFGGWFCLSLVVSPIATFLLLQVPTEKEDKGG